MLSISCFKDLHDDIDVINVQIKIKNVKNVKRDKNKKNVCKRNTKRYRFTPDAQEMAFKATRNMPFSLVLCRRFTLAVKFSILCYVTQCVKHSKYVKVHTEAFQVIRHATEKSYNVGLFRWCYFESASC